VARNPELVAAVRKSYIVDRLDLKAAAMAHDASYASACRWKAKAKKDGDCWDKARAAARMTGGGLGDLSAQVMEDFSVQYKTLMDEIKTAEDIPPMKKADILTKLADSYIKISKAAGNGDNNIGRLSVAMETIELLAGFIKERYPEQLEMFVHMLERFAPELSKQYG
jgi:hypothetical protein